MSDDAMTTHIARTGSGVGGRRSGDLMSGRQPLSVDRIIFASMNMKTARGIAAVFASAIVAAAPGYAHADPAPDPHMPNFPALYCPGGGAGTPALWGYCDGEHYPDGSFWHVVQNGPPVMVGGETHPNGNWATGPQCVIDSGPIPAPAPPDGCGRGAPPAG